MPSAGTEPAGHLAAEEPYGMGSASAASDGSGPSDYTVKADAGAMVYYEEGHPEYEQTRADVWFESTAHAEAAGLQGAAAEAHLAPLVPYRGRMLACP
jgi:hypothetical protein